MAAWKLVRTRYVVPYANRVRNHSYRLVWTSRTFTTLAKAQEFELECMDFGYATKPIQKVNTMEQVRWH